MMTQEHLLQYLAGILRIELEVFVQDKTIAELTRQKNSLGIHKKITVPHKGQSKISYGDCTMITGVICAILAGVILGIMSIVSVFQEDQGFFYFIAAVVAAVLYAAGGFLVGSFGLGSVVWFLLRMRENRALEEKLQADIDRYDSEVNRQNIRIRQENAKKKALDREITALRASRSNTLRYLEEAYSYDIIDPEYRNIYAVGSFYGYLRKGRTCCLQFDRATGDQGAYNLYENERRLDLIITNTDEILNRLDQVIQNQYDLATGLQEASAQIKSLCGSVNRQLRSISGTVESIERCQSIIAYNSECNKRNLDFLTWMHTLYY